MKIEDKVICVDIKHRTDIKIGDEGIIVDLTDNERYGVKFPNATYVCCSTNPNYINGWATIKLKEEKVDVRNTKIWIGNNPKLSKQVQERLFELGCEWYAGGSNIKYTESSDAIYINSNLLLAKSSSGKLYFDTTSEKEITLTDLNTKTINMKVTFKPELAKAAYEEGNSVQKEKIIANCNMFNQTCSEDFIKEAYVGACDKWKKILEKEYPSLFKQNILEQIRSLPEHIGYTRVSEENGYIVLAYPNANTEWSFEVWNLAKAICTKFGYYPIHGNSVEESGITDLNKKLVLRKSA